MTDRKTIALAATAVVAVVLFFCASEAWSQEATPLGVGPYADSVAPVPVESGYGVNQVDPATLTCTGLIDFEDVTGGSAPGTNYDGVLVSGLGSVAESFVNQTVSFVGNFDALSGTPTSPLTLQVGSPNQNVNVFSRDGDNVSTGLGPTGFPNFSSIGEGSFAALFDSAQFELGFTIVGADGGSATVNFFAADGSLIDTMVLSPLIGDQNFAFRRAGNVRDIAGLSIHNDDPGGIGYDDFIICEVQGDLDIKPGSCPNPVNCRSNGLMPVALLGSLSFDVKQVDLDSLQLCLKDGVGGCCPPERVRFEDAATPFPGDPQSPDDCCHELGGDGIQDLLMKFRTRLCCENLGLTETSFISFELNGLLLDGTPFSAEDCIRVVREGDLDGDGLVGVADLLRLLAQWGLCGPTAECSADYNGDDMVGVVDLLIMLGNWS